MRSVDQVWVDETVDVALEVTEDERLCLRKRREKTLRAWWVLVRDSEGAALRYWKEGYVIWLFLSRVFRWSD